MIITYDGSYMHKPVRYIVDVDAEDDALEKKKEEGFYDGECARDKGKKAI